MQKLGTKKLASFAEMPASVGDTLKQYLPPSVFAVRAGFDSTAAERCFLGSMRLVLLGSRVVVAAPVCDVQSYMSQIGQAATTTTELCHFLRNMVQSQASSCIQNVCTLSPRLLRKQRDKRERDRECACVCVCAIERGRERERERETERERERESREQRRTNGWRRR